jgi:hypothetical protein
MMSPVCLGVLRFDPDDDWPILLVSIRDEYIERPALSPARWWPQFPQLVGGKDARAGGTWLAMDSDVLRVAAVYTPGKPTAADSGLRSRGELPLIALTGEGSGAPAVGGDRGDLPLAIDPSRYEPFSLLVADRTTARWSVWKDGEWTQTTIEPGMHVLNNWGLDVMETAPRQKRWLPPFAAAAPEKVVLDGVPQDTWAGWIDLLGHEPEPDVDDSLLLRREVEGHPYGTKSASLIAIGQGGLRYDSSEQPWDPTSWGPVELGV